MADALVATGLRLAVVNVRLASRSGKSKGAGTLKTVDQIQASSSIQTRIGFALVDVDLALDSRETRHTHTPERSRIVQTASLILARMTFALIHIRLATRTSESLRTVTRKRSRSVHTNPVMLTRRSLVTFIDVLRTVNSLVSRSTRTRKRSIYRTRITQRVRMARIRCARIIQMAQQSRFAGRTTTIEAAYSIDARRTIKARGVHTVVNVLAAIRSRPAVNADTRIASVRIRASGAVLADGRSHGAFIDIVLAVFANVVAGALAAIGVDSVDACAAVLAEMSGTVVDVVLAVGALESWKGGNEYEMISKYFQVQFKYLILLNYQK